MSCVRTTDIAILGRLQYLMVDLTVQWADRNDGNGSGVSLHSTKGKTQYQGVDRCVANHLE